MIRRLITIVMWPVYLALLAVRIVFDLLNRLSAWVFYIIAFLLLLTAGLCYYMEIDTALEIRRTLIGSGIFFMIPQSVSILAGMAEVAAEVIRNRILSA